MKKYLCPNCGFKNKFQVIKNKHSTHCKNCNANVYTSKIVLKNIMIKEAKHVTDICNKQKEKQHQMITPDEHEQNIWH